MCTQGPKVLLALSAEDARHYADHWPRGEVTGAKVVVLGRDQPEGLRVSGAFATPGAKEHPDYPRVLHALRRSYSLCNADAPRVF